MANIKQFKGLRPGKDMAHLIAELPYDVVDSKEAKVIAQNNKHNFYHVLRPEVDLPDGINLYDDIVYETGRKNLKRFIDDGELVIDEAPGLYLYTLIANGRAQTGLVTCVHIDDYVNNVIKKHELTLEHKEKDRMRHIDVLNANTGMVFLFYKEDGTNSLLFEEAMKALPEYDFITDDGIRHILRLIYDKDLIETFKNSFKNRTLYIADGHHRAASSVAVGLQRRKNSNDYNGDEEYNWFLAVIFPHDQLGIMAYNRVVRDLNGYSADTYIEKLRERYIVVKDEHTTPGGKHRFCMYLDGEWHSLVLDSQVKENSVDSLDAQILYDTILNPILGIKKMRGDERVDFIGGIKGAKELQRLVDSGEYRVAFSLYPVSIDELIEISEMGEIMPPKSTWFEPKLRSGLVVHLL